MSRVKLPEHAKRVQVSLSLSATAIAVLDAFVETGHVETRSRAAETAIMQWFAATRTKEDKRR